MIHLIQPQELYGPHERQAELSTAWRNNAPIFDVTTKVHGRPDFTELFKMCLPDHVNVIANSDIYFDHTLTENIDKLGPREVWALSRWDDHGDHLIPYHKRDSQDAWIIRGAIDIEAPYKMGVPGIDNVLAHVLLANFYDVTNPCETVRAIHLHRSGYRTYGAGRGQEKMYRYGPPYAFVQPCSL